MPISTELAKQGQFLFRWRSFLPLLLLIPGAVAFTTDAAIVTKYGDVLADFWVVIGLAISLAGLAIRWITVGYVPAGTSGRNTTEQRAFVLNTTGMYSISRNPLYVGNFFAILGLIISIKVWWLVAIFILAWWLYIERIIAAEEKFLTESFGEEYTEWAARTPAYWPNCKLWRKPVLPFSWKTVLRREYNGLFGVGAAFCATEFLVDVVFAGEDFQQWLHEDSKWIFGFLLTAVIFLTLRTLKKHTKLLHVEGR